MGINDLLESTHQPEKTTISFRIETELLKWLDNAARQKGLDRSSALNQLLRLLKEDIEG